MLRRIIVERRQPVVVISDLRDCLGKLWPRTRLRTGLGHPGPAGDPRRSKSRPAPSSPPNARILAARQAHSKFYETSIAAPWSAETPRATRPKTLRSVTGCERRGAHPAWFAVSQQIRPRLGGIPVPIGQGHEFLAPVDAHADQHQQARFVLFRTIVDVDAIRRQVDVVHLGQVTLGKHTLLGLPLLGQLRDHRRREALRRAAELAQTPAWSSASCVPTPAGSPRRTSHVRRCRGQCDGR